MVDSRGRIGVTPAALSRSELYTSFFVQKCTFLYFWVVTVPRRVAGMDIAVRMNCIDTLARRFPGRYLASQCGR